MIRCTFPRLAAAVGLLLMAASAQAAHLEFAANAQNTVPPSNGKWNVTMDSADLINWTVSITGDSVSFPNADVQQITLTFFDASFNSINVLSGDGGVVSPTYTDWGATVGTNIKFDKPAGTANWLLSSNPGGAPPAGNTGGSVFNGFLTLDSSIKVGSVTVNMQDSGRQWNGNAPVTPEGSALAALLPALLPIGMVIRRRRTLNKAA